MERTKLCKTSNVCFFKLVMQDKRGEVVVDLEGIHD